MSKIVFASFSITLRSSVCQVSVWGMPVYQVGLILPFLELSDRGGNESSKVGDEVGQEIGLAN